MLVVVIQPINAKIAKQQIIAAMAENVKIIELRLDYWQSNNFAELSELKSKFPLRMIFTLRSKYQGGFYPHDEDKRKQDILSLCELNPDYFDLEYDLPKEFIQEVKNKFPHINLICSYHDFKETPENLLGILKQMQNDMFYAYKIATHANSIIDSLRMLLFVKSMHDVYSLTGLCMGELGQCTRVLGTIFGNQFSYASLNETRATASGQLTVAELKNIYHFTTLNRHSKIYALIGNPVKHSVGHILHNQAIQTLKKNAVYFKLQINHEELSQAVKYMRELEFAGLSITMPFKEQMATLIDQFDDKVQAIRTINSVIVIKNKWLGFNTDGAGAILALPEKVDLQQQTIVILGAGGAAKAIAYAALQQGARVIILNRTLQKAKQLANEINVETFNLEQIAYLKKLSCTVLINTLPITEKEMYALLKPEYLTPNVIAMDIVYQPIETAFLKIAKQANCTCIPGYKMYIHQALLQISRWFSVNDLQLFEIKEEMEQYFSSNYSSKLI